MKRLWPLLALILCHCESLPSGNNLIEENRLFTLKNVTITSYDGASFDYRIKADEAFGDQALINMQNIRLNGQNANSGYQLTVKNGLFKTKDLSGELKDGLTLTFDGGYTLTTSQAFFSKKCVTTDQPVKFSGPAISLLLDGASLNIINHQIESLGQSEGLFSPATF